MRGARTLERERLRERAAARFSARTRFVRSAHSGRRRSALPASALVDAIAKAALCRVGADPGGGKLASAHVPARKPAPFGCRGLSREAGGGSDRRPAPRR